MIVKANGLVELIDDYFYEIIDDDLIRLKESDAYKRIQKEKEELFEQYPTIKKFIVDEKAVSFTEEDADGIRQLLALNISISTLEMQCCYYKGMRDYIDLLETIKNEK